MLRELLPEGPPEVVSDPARLEALRGLELLDSPAELAFDRLALLAAHLLRAPVALVCLVDENRQYLKSCVGLDEPWFSRRELPLTHSFCQHVVALGQPLIIADAREHPLVRHNPAITDLRILAYAGIPLTLSGGLVIGTLCVFDHMPRDWSREEITILRHLTALVMTEIELRAESLANRRAAQEREQLIEQLQEALKLQERLLSTSAHELKTPLTSLLGNAQLLQRRAEDGGMGEREQRLLQAIVDDVCRLDELIESLADVSRLQRGRFTVQHVPVDLNALLQDLTDELRPRLQRHRLSLLLPERSTQVLGDQRRLRQALGQLLDNAVGYSPGGGLILVQLERRNGRAQISISDEGIGIAQQAQDQIFRPFYRAPNASMVRPGGLGIGLYLVKEILKLHGGTIEVLSAEYEGSTFQLSLPLQGAQMR